MTSVKQFIVKVDGITQLKTIHHYSVLRFIANHPNAKVISVPLAR